MIISLNINKPISLALEKLFAIHETRTDFLILTKVTKNTNFLTLVYLCWQNVLCKVNQQIVLRTPRLISIIQVLDNVHERNSRVRQQGMHSDFVSFCPHIEGN
jgi:hypothetical protein